MPDNAPLYDPALIRACNVVLRMHHVTMNGLCILV